jgi:DNA-binding MarR family transcriptional regulator
MMTAATSAKNPKPALFKTVQLLEQLRELFPDLPIQTISVFLIIAMKPGMYQRDLLKLLDISQAGVSRNVMALGELNRHGKPGLGLIFQRKDPFDNRQVMLNLTPSGKALAERLTSIVSA